MSVVTMLWTQLVQFSAGTRDLSIFQNVKPVAGPTQPPIKTGTGDSFPGA